MRILLLGWTWQYLVEITNSKCISLVVLLRKIPLIQSTTARICSCSFEWPQSLFQVRIVKCRIIQVSNSSVEWSLNFSNVNIFKVKKSCVARSVTPVDKELPSVRKLPSISLNSRTYLKWASNSGLSFLSLSVRNMRLLGYILNSSVCWVPVQQKTLSEIKQVKQEKPNLLEDTEHLINNTQGFIVVFICICTHRDTFTHKHTHLYIWTYIHTQLLFIHRDT